MKMSDKVYNVLKWITMIVLPAIGTCYAALATIWGFPYAEQIVGTIAAVTTLLGALIGISTSNYNKAIIAQNRELSESGREDGVGEDGEENGDDQ